jgi:hypothetical protein
MEGAVRSGQTAAAELDHAGSADANGNRPARTAEAAA